MNENKCPKCRTNDFSDCHSIECPMRKNKQGRPKGQSTMESWMIANGKEGEHFYSDKMDRHLTAIAAYHKRKIITERLIAIKPGDKEPISKYITKVTLL